MEYLTSKNIKVVIGIAPMEDAVALKNAIHSKINIPDFNLDMVKGGIGDILQGTEVKPFIDAFLSIESDKEVNRYIMQCLERSSYNSEKITMRTFDTAEAREEYYRIITLCVKVNVVPFYKGLPSVWKMLGEMFKSKNSPA